MNPAKNEVNTEIKIMRISSTNAIEGGRVLYTIGRIEAASAWHPAHGSPLQENWRELVLRELTRKAEDIDADAIIRVDYQNDGVIRIDDTGVNLKRVVATGIAVKLSCAAARR
jgi:Putative heavy-metal-binding